MEEKSKRKSLIINTLGHSQVPLEEVDHSKVTFCGDLIGLASCKCTLSKDEER
jgi:hypothetical protein